MTKLGADHTKRYLTAKINQWSLQDLNRVVSVDNSDLLGYIEDVLTSISDINDHAKKMLTVDDEKFERFVGRLVKSL